MEIFHTLTPTLPSTTLVQSKLLSGCPSLRLLINYSYFFSNFGVSSTSSLLLCFSSIFLRRKSDAVNSGELLFLQYQPHRFVVSCRRVKGLVLHRGTAAGGGARITRWEEWSLPCLLPGLSLEGRQPHELRVMPVAMSQPQGSQGAPFRLRGDCYFWGYGTYYEMQVRAFLVCTKLAVGCLRGGTEGGEREGSQWFVEEQVWGR